MKQKYYHRYTKNGYLWEPYFTWKIKYSIKLIAVLLLEKYNSNFLKNKAYLKVLSQILDQLYNRTVTFKKSYILYHQPKFLLSLWHIQDYYPNNVPSPYGKRSGHYVMPNLVIIQ